MYRYVIGVHFQPTKGPWRQHVVLVIQVVYAVHVVLAVHVVHFRLAKGHLEATVKHVFKNTTADELSKSYNDFFLSKADDIADQLKTSPGVSSFEAHQMVCDMVQVSIV